MAPGRNGWRVNPARQYGVFNPAERRLSSSERRVPTFWVVVLLALACWALLLGTAWLVDAGLHLVMGGSP